MKNSNPLVNNVLITYSNDRHDMILINIGDANKKCNINNYELHIWHNRSDIVIMSFENESQAMFIFNSLAHGFKY